MQPCKKTSKFFFIFFRYNFPSLHKFSVCILCDLDWHPTFNTHFNFQDHGPILRTSCLIIYCCIYIIFSSQALQHSCTHSISIQILENHTNSLNFIRTCHPSYYLNPHLYFSTYLMLVGVILKPCVSLRYCSVSLVFLSLVVVLFCISNTRKNTQTQTPFFITVTNTEILCILGFTTSVSRTCFQTGKQQTSRGSF